MPNYPNNASTTASLTTYVFTSLRKRIAEHPGPLYRLHIGDTYLDPLPVAQAQAQRTDENEGLHRYAAVQGQPELLDAIAEKLRRRSGVRVPLENLQVTAGATAGLSTACQALLDPGDEVLVLAPFWPLSAGIVAARGAVAVQVPFYDKLTNAEFDPEAALESAITPRTVAIYVNTPNNPTGVALSDDVLDMLAKVAARHNLWVMSDEVYEDLWLGPHELTPLWTRPNLAQRTVAIHSMSKGYGLAGARVGWVHGPSEAMRAIRAVQTFHSYCASKPMQLAAARALLEGEAWLKMARDAYREAALLTSQALNLPMPAGGTFVFFNVKGWLPDGEEDASLFLHRCLDEGVVITPGAASGEAYRSWVRVCFTCVPLTDLREGLSVVRRVLNQPPSH